MILPAAVAALAVFLIVAPAPRAALADRIAAYLSPRPVTPSTGDGADPPVVVRRAGMSWSRTEYHVRMAAAVAVGAAAGGALAVGDLFLSGPGTSAPGLVALGAVTGGWGFRMVLSSLAERRAAALREELPTVTDALALEIMAGRSVSGALRATAAGSSGVAAHEIEEVLRGHDAGAGLAASLHRATRVTADPEAARLYLLLGHAHDTGGRLADALRDLAVDYRADLARRLTAEGGKKAVASYGPILALMVPTALLFMIYPALAGLRGIAGT